ncbi:MAG: efflux RND transporter permease subunit, partial [Candidatus Omnitrophica bacterium]|nr:efflux RND transporter permease subunit [Candidatus Omnitrophota bacterium]
INVMTMSGLALSIGVLVDSSIVVLENILKKLDEGKRAHKAVVNGTEEVWLALVTSQATNIVVFLPIVFIDKTIQIMYQGFAFTVAFSLVISTCCAIMLSPVLISEWFKMRPDFALNRQRKTEKVNAVLEKVRQGYLQMMQWNFANRGFVLIIALILFALALRGLLKKDIDWPETMEEKEFAIVVFPLAGARIEANDQAVKKIEELLSRISEIKLFSSTVRKDEIRIFVKLVPKNKRKYSKEEIMHLIDEKGNEAIKQIHDSYSLIIDQGAGGSETRKMVINIYGQENDVLEKLAHEVAGKIQNIPGLTNLVMTDLRKRPEYSLVVDKGRAAIYGLTVQDIADSAHAQIRGMRPTKFHELSQGLEIETITRLQAIYRQKVEDLQQIYVGTKHGGQVPLGDVASFHPSFGPQTIDRKDKFRYVFVRGDTHRPLETIAREVREALKDIKWPDDYYWRFGGYYEELLKGKTQLSLALILSLFLVYGTMACLFQSYWQPLVIMATIPLASIGIWAGLTLTHKPLSQPVFIGMILLAGYVVNAAIILMDRMNTLQAQGFHFHKETLLIQAGLDRLRAILMTTVSTTIGFLPMALSIGEGSELWSPLAITVIGGLLSSTVLTLFVVPDIILIFEGVGAWSKKLANQKWWPFREASTG